MLKLDEKVRDEIVQVLQAQIAPAIVGSVLVQIANILSKLEKIVEPSVDPEKAPKKHDK